MAYRQDNNRSSRQQPVRQQRGSGRVRQQQETRKQNYHPLFQLFAVDHGNRIAINIKPIKSTSSSIKDVLSIEQFLFLCEKLYYGEITLTGALFDSNIPQANWTGNIRLSDDQLEDLLAEFESQLQPKKTSAKKASTRKPQYEVPEEDEEETEEDYEDSADLEDASY